MAQDEGGFTIADTTQDVAEFKLIPVGGDDLNYRLVWQHGRPLAVIHDDKIVSDQVYRQGAPPEPSQVVRVAYVLVGRSADEANQALTAEIEKMNEQLGKSQGELRSAESELSKFASRVDLLARRVKSLESCLETEETARKQSKKECKAVKAQLGNIKAKLGTERFNELIEKEEDGS